MYNTKAYSAASATSPLASTTIPRREPTERDVQIEILFCGICHSDLHLVRNEWSECHAHGLPVRAGPRDRRPGDQGRLGGDEVQAGRPRRRRLPGRLGPHLPELPGGPRAVLPEHDPHLQLPGQAPGRPVTYGGYSDSIVVDERFVLRVPAEPRSRRGRAAALRRDHDLLAAAPLGRRRRARRSASSASAGSATWA